MSTITESDLQARPAEAVKLARENGGLVIRCDDGSELTLTVTRPAASQKRHPLRFDPIPGLEPMTPEQIVQLVRDARDEYDREKEANCRHE